MGGDTNGDEGRWRDDHVPQGSGKQFGEDVADIDPDDATGQTRRGSGKQFGEGPGHVEQPDEDETVPPGSGKQFAEDVADVHEEPATGEGSEKGFARGQARDEA